MAKIGPLTPDQARATIAHRLGSRLAPKVRQLNTKFGLRPQRVFLVWTRWNGAERGEGKEAETYRAELLPTPKVDSMDGVAFSLLQAGTVPVGSVKVSEVSVSYTEDQLRGLAQPPTHADSSCCVSASTCMLEHVAPVLHPEHITEPNDFYYEVVEDGRGDDPPHRAKFRLLNRPFRRADKLDWSLLLERVGQDNNREGSSATGQGTEG